MSKGLKGRIAIYDLTFFTYDDWKTYLSDREHDMEVIDLTWSMLQEYIETYSEYVRIGILAKDIHRRIKVSHPGLARYQFDDEWMDFFGALQLLAIDIV